MQIEAQDLVDEITGSDLLDEPESVDNARKLELAKAALQFAIGLMEEVADDTGNEYARAYLIDHLKIMASRDHGFLSRDFNLDQWIECVDEPEANEGGNA